MFKILVIQAQNGLSDDETEFLINDRLSFNRFLGLGLGDRVPDTKTIWMFRERLTRAGAMDRLFRRFDAAIRAADCSGTSSAIASRTAIEGRMDPQPLPPQSFMLVLDEYSI